MGEGTTMNMRNCIETWITEVLPVGPSGPSGPGKPGGPGGPEKKNKLHINLDQQPTYPPVLSVVWTCLLNLSCL